MNMQKRFILNADDVGMHPAVDEAVLHLAESGIVSSASVMALQQPDAGTLLALQRGGVDLGLHFDLTSAAAASRYGLPGTVGALLARAYTGRLDRQKLRGVIDEQLQRFSEVAGRMPVFIDGHEHVHQFPVVRDALMQVLSRWPVQERPFLRDTRPRRWRGAKAAVIGMLGAHGLAVRADKLHCTRNTDFLGVYPLQHEVNLHALWRGWLQAMPTQGALAMCHPASSVFAAGNAFRLREYLFLCSAAFAEMRNQYNINIVGWHAALRETPDGAAFCAG
jgi:predicted glycoside hydrolase/deacetylase ChbG (UPF0249 family)